MRKGPREEVNTREDSQQPSGRWRGQCVVAPSIGGGGCGQVTNRREPETTVVSQSGLTQ